MALVIIINHYLLDSILGRLCRHKVDVSIALGVVVLVDGHLGT